MRRIVALAPDFLNSFARMVELLKTTKNKDTDRWETIVIGVTDDPCWEMGLPLDATQIRIPEHGDSTLDVGTIWNEDAEEAYSDEIIFFVPPQASITSSAVISALASCNDTNIIYTLNENNNLVAIRICTERL